MRILLPENTAFELDHLAEAASDVDIHYGVLDNTDPQDPDYKFHPLIFVESFYSPTLKLQIGKYTIQVPIDWQILIGEPEHGEYEVISLSSLNDRNFKAFVLNPLSSFRPEFYQIDIVDIYSETRWFLPKIKAGHLLCVPLESGPKPKCVYFIKDCPRNSEIILASKAF